MPAFKLATDCSGLDTPVYAFRKTSQFVAGKISLEHVFSSETDPTAREFIESNHSPTQVFDDCSARVPDEIDAEEIDCLVAGFPCQPFSALGKRRGFRDRRSKAYKGILKTLQKRRRKSRRPLVRSVLLENVASIQFHNGGESLNKILSDLQECGYRAIWRKFFASESRRLRRSPVRPRQ